MQSSSMTSGNSASVIFLEKSRRSATASYVLEAVAAANI
jgi:hypothetical protein